jgi:hypothetical protein
MAQKEVSVILADDFMRAGHDAPPEQPFDTYRHVADLIGRAHRFMIGEEAQAACVNLLSHRPSALLEAVSWARLPFPTVWMEWIPPQDAPIHEGQFRAARVGALMRQEGPSVIRLFTCWRLGAHAPGYEAAMADISSRRHRDFLKQVDPLGVSALEGAWDFGGLSGNPGLQVTTAEEWARARHRPVGEWFQMPFATDHDPAKLAERARDRRNNGFRFALKDSGEMLALRKIERCSAFRVHAEAAGAETIELALRQHKSLSPLIRDVEDEMGHMLAVLILINAKNCVEITKTEPPEKLNKARLKLGKSPLVSYSTVAIKLNRPDERAAGSGDYDHAAIQRHIVRGHFKVRATGVYWWRPFMRGSEDAGVTIRKGYEVG